MLTIEYLRQFRVGGFALFDFTVSFLGMGLLSPLLSGLFKKLGVYIPKWNWVILTLPISVLAHVIFGRFTPLTKQFLDPTGYPLVKLVIVICTILGFMRVRRIRA